MDHIEPAVISMIASVASAIVAALVMSHNMRKDKDAKDRAMDERLSGLKTDIAVLSSNVDMLSKHVEKHNGVIERMYELEVREAMLEKKFGTFKTGGTD